MAAQTIAIKVYQCGEYEVTVSFKVMRNIRYRMSKNGQNLVEMSVPHTMNDDQIREMLDRLYPSIQRLAARTEAKSINRISRPDSQSHARWRAHLEILIPLVEKEMDLAARHYTLRYMTSRWGSCVPARGNISLNSALAMLDEECTHYVLVHELAHLKHANHSPAFWQLVERFYPDYRRIRARLRSKLLV